MTSFFKSGASQKPLVDQETQSVFKNSNSFASKKGSKKTTTKKEDLSFTLKGINIPRIDKDFNMDEMKNIGKDLSFDDAEEKTSLEKLGISSLEKEPLVTTFPKEKTKLQTFTTMIDLKEKKLPQTTNIPCFGCRRKFTTRPLGVPIEYHPSTCTKNNKTRNLTILEQNQLMKKYKDRIVEKDYFDVDGIVCSFNCMYTVIEENPSPLYKKTPYVIPELYRHIFGVYPNERILKSEWRLRREYGGPLTDEEFEKNLQTLKFTDTHHVVKCNLVGKIFKVE